MFWHLRKNRSSSIGKCTAKANHRLISYRWHKVTATQYGLLKTWQVDERGVYLDGIRVGDTTLDQLELMTGNYVSLRIGIKKDAECKGGISLFGEKFGNYGQPILITIGYVMSENGI